jgi:hypothetical protein
MAVGVTRHGTGGAVNAERGFALLAQRWQILQTVTASPGKIGLIAARQVRGVQVPQVMQALPVRGMGGVLVPYVRDPVDQQGPRVVAWYYPQDQYVQVRALTEWHRHDLRDPGRLDLRGAVIGGRLNRLLLDPLTIRSSVTPTSSSPP